MFEQDLRIFAPDLASARMWHWQQLSFLMRWQLFLSSLSSLVGTGISDFQFPIIWFLNEEISSLHWDSCWRFSFIFLWILQSLKGFIQRILKEEKSMLLTKLFVPAQVIDETFVRLWLFSCWNLWFNSWWKLNLILSSKLASFCLFVSV